VLDAMEVIDYENPTLSTKKRLLHLLYPDYPFEARFGKYIQQRGAVFIFLENNISIVICDSCLL